MSTRYMKCYLYFKGDIFLYSSDEKYPLDTCCDQTKMTLDILVEVYSCNNRRLKNTLHGMLLHRQKVKVLLFKTEIFYA